MTRTRQQAARIEPATALTGARTGSLTGALTGAPGTGPVVVYGAGGHTGRFVVEELRRRGLPVVPAGRRAATLADAPADAGGRADEARVFAVDDLAATARALAGAAVVVNCAGPFLDTALPLARAAVAAGAHYLDVTAEQPVVQSLYDELDEAALRAGVSVVPAMAFYGGLADLLVTSALQGAASADEVEVAIALDRWWPTAGTRATGQRNTAPRLVIERGRPTPLAQPAPSGTWAFPAPFGDQDVVQLPFSEVPVVHRHLAVGELRSWLGTAPLADLRDPATPAPTATDDLGRSEQRFAVDVRVRGAAGQRRLTATGRDIYAVTAPLVAEGVARLIDGRCRVTGAVAPGQAFDAEDLLAALVRHPAGIRLSEPPTDSAAEL